MSGSEVSGVEVFEAERARLTGLAYRMLGSISDAEDEAGRHRTCHRELQARGGRRRARAVDQLRQVQQARGHRRAAGSDHHRTRTHRPSVAANHLPPAVHGLLQA